MNRFGNQDAQRIIQGSNIQNDANVDQGQVLNPALLRSIVIDLSEERTLAAAMQLRFNFDCIRIASANSDTAVVNMQFFRNEENQSYMSMGNKDVANFSMTMNTAILTWPAQPGTIIKVDFYIGIKFESGSNLIDLKSQANSFNIAAQSLQNNELNCLLYGLIDAIGTPIAVGDCYVQKTMCLNNPQYNTNDFVVPVGYEFIVSGASKRNIYATNSADIETIELYASEVDQTLVSGMTTIADPLIDQLFSYNGIFCDTNYPFNLTVPDSELINFPWQFSNQLLGPDEFSRVSEGNSVGAIINNANTTLGLDLNTRIEIYIIGYLRRVV